MNKHTIVKGGLIIALVAVGGSFLFVTTKTARLHIESPRIVYVDGSEASYDRNLNIAENLIGSSHNIFIGKVVGLSANQRGGSYAQFDVDVVLNIKGVLRGRVTVNTFAWEHKGEIRMRKGSVWPQSGATYLFVTRYSAANDWYTLIDFYTGQDVSWKLISDNASLTENQLQQLANSDPRVQQLQAAYPKEEIPEADIYHNNVRNSYQSLSEAEKAALPYYTPPPSPPTPSSTPTSTGE